MRHGQLFVSVWHIGLENLPEDTFVHRRLMHDEAKRLIEEARHAGTPCCASHDDLFAPYENRERRNHQKLCRVLGEQCGITLTLEDFAIRDEIEGEDSCTIGNFPDGSHSPENSRGGVRGASHPFASRPAFIHEE